MRPGFILCLLLILLISACKSKVENKLKLKRDITITHANAFTKLFLDSTKLENYIIKQKAEDSAANRLRNFYNSRNFQFAWFSFTPN